MSRVAVPVKSTAPLNATSGSMSVESLTVTDVFTAVLLTVRISEFVPDTPSASPAAVHPPSERVNTKFPADSVMVRFSASAAVSVKVSRTSVSVPELKL